MPAPKDLLLGDPAKAVAHIREQLDFVSVSTLSVRPQIPAMGL